MPHRIIAVHGWLAGGSLFDPLIERLNATGIDCVAMDCRGYGERRDEAGPFTIAIMAADVLHLADELGWDRFHVLGHSMAGMAVQRIMLDAPGRLDSAILVAPVPACGSKMDEARRGVLLRAIRDSEVRRERIDANTGRRRDSQWLDAMLRLSLDSTEPAVLEAYLPAWTELDFSAEMPGCQVPAVCICGELDPAVPAAWIEQTIQRWCPNSTLVQMAGVGHYPMQEEPAALARIIEQHVAAL